MSNLRAFFFLAAFGAAAIAGAQATFTDTFYDNFANADAGNNVTNEQYGAWPGNPFTGNLITAHDQSGALVADGTGDSTGAYDQLLNTFSLTATGSATQVGGAYASGYGLAGVYFTLADTEALTLAGLADPQGSDGSYYGAQIQDVADPNHPVVLWDKGLINPGGTINDVLTLGPGSYFAVVNAWAFAQTSASNSGQVNMQGAFTPVPEPATMATLALGALIALKRKGERAAR